MRSTLASSPTIALFLLIPFLSTATTTTTDCANEININPNEEEGAIPGFTADLPPPPDERAPGRSQITPDEKLNRPEDELILFEKELNGSKSASACGGGADDEKEVFTGRLDDGAVAKREIANQSANHSGIPPGNDSVSDEDYLVQIEDFIFPKAWTWVLIFFHSVVFVIGLVGNTLVCVAVFRNHTMRTVTNYFIMNLAVADFLVILFCLPPTVIWDVTMTWFFGITMCKIVLYLQTISVTVSVLTLTFISVDRWYAICYPLKFKSTTGRAKTAIAVIWILALLFDIPELIVYRTVKNEHLQIDTIYFTQCAPSWSIDTDTSWTVLKMILLYAVPLLFMTVTYCQIVRVLWMSGNINQQHLGTPGSSSSHLNAFPMNTNTNIEGQLRSRKKAAKMLVAVVVMFAFCYFPVHLLSVLRLTIGLTNSDTNRAFALISHWLCYANSAVNPIIYNFMSGKFRKEFRRAFDCCSPSGRDHLGYQLNSLYYKNTAKDSGGPGSTRFRTLRRTDTQRTNTDTNFIHRRSTRTSVIKIDV